MSKVISSVDCSIILLGSLLLEKINEPCVIKLLLFFFFFSLHLRMRASVLLICFTLASLKHFTRDTNPQNGFVTWSLHSSSAFHSNKRIIPQSPQNFLTILPKKKKRRRRKKETKIALFHFLRAHYESMVDGGGNGNLLQYSCWENPMDRGAWQAIIHGVTKNWTELKWWSTHTHIHICWSIYICLSLGKIEASLTIFHCHPNLLLIRILNQTPDFKKHEGTLQNWVLKLLTLEYHFLVQIKKWRNEWHTNVFRP